MNSTSLSAKSRQFPDRIFILPVGGCGEFGMNLTVYAYRGRSYIVDCGLAFAEPFEIGIDAHIPSPDLLEEILGEPPAAFLITHGHEDHLGALPFFLERWNTPVYIGPWARELLAEKLQQRGDRTTYSINPIKEGDRITVGDITVDWIHVPHSIPFCFSLVIQAGDMRIVHTGDFKTKGYHPYDADLLPSTLDAIAKSGPTLALVADSTNAHAPGFCPSEATVIPELKRVVQGARGVSYISTFSSNLWRLKSILDIAQELDKKVFIFGTGMRKSVELGVKLKLLNQEIKVLIDEEGLRSTARKDLIVICTGCQGEYRSGLRRIIEDDVRFLEILPHDQIIFSSRMIPGNEKSIAKMVSLGTFKGADIITAKEYPSIHVSGHAYAEDLKLFLDRLKPRFHIPVHGTFTQMRANQHLAEADSFLSMSNGRLLSLGHAGAQVEDEYELERLFVDSWSRQPMDYATMRARHKIGDSGMALVSGLLGQGKDQLEVEFVGLPFASLEIEEAFQSELVHALFNLYKRLNTNGLTADTYNEQARLLIRRALTDRFVKKPIVFSKVFLMSGL